ncbi:uncharacterized protein [Dendrobates tinctorius]|uniref:uncharacterized protein n=1 Tax=Dendrobates tinctorius TaxID=92724 RepID=UPI003CC928B9
MESQKLQKRKKKKNRASLHRPHSSQLYELDETLTNEDVLFICLLENSMKSKEKDKKRKTKIDKTGRTLPCGVESLSQYSQKGQDRSLDRVCSSKATKKTKRKRKRVVIKANSISKISNMSDEPFESPVKKKKKKKLAMLSQIQASTSSSSRIKHIGPAPQNISDGKTHKRSNIEATTDPKRKSTATDNDEISQRVRKHSLLYTCTPLSSPTALPKTKRDIKHISPGKAEDMEGMSNLRQEVQKQFGLTQCLTKPLDFSLASRIRAERNILSPSDDVIEVGSQSPPVKPEASKNEKVIFSFNPLKNAQSTKFIQTFLNPSYFFRKKGRSGKLNVVTPLLKVNNQGKSHGKKEIGAN